MELSELLLLECIDIATSKLERGQRSGIDTIKYHT